MRKIAITGSLAVGKSTVCGILQEYGAYVVDADEIVHRLLSPPTVTGQKVIKLLGPEIVVGNQIDRKKIAEIVFSDSKKLNALEAILHPIVKKEINARFKSVKKNPSYKFFVAEVPLLYEAGMEKEFDTVITVTADEKIVRRRAAGSADFEQRQARQLSSAVKASKADFVISNNGDLNLLRSSIQVIVNSLFKETE